MCEEVPLNLLLRAHGLYTLGLLLRYHLSGNGSDSVTVSLIFLERVLGNSPSSLVWKTRALILDDTRMVG